LRTPQLVGGNLNHAEAVGLLPHASHLIVSLQASARALAVSRCRYG
jgi:hypothetical protein